MMDEKFIIFIRSIWKLINLFIHIIVIHQELRLLIDEMSISLMNKSTYGHILLWRWTCEILNVDCVKISVKEDADYIILMREY